MNHMSDIIGGQSKASRNEPVPQSMMDDIGNRVGRMTEMAADLARAADRLLGESPEHDAGPQVGRGGRLGSVHGALDDLERALKAAMRLTEVA